MVNRSLYVRFPELVTIPKDTFPKHVAIIPDGNRRWAKSRGLKTVEGHKKGAECILQIIKDLREIKEVKIITLWGFSADNWKRNKEESDAIFYLIGKQLEAISPELMKHNARFIHLGRKDRISDRLRNTIEKIENKTANNKGQIICIAIDFGGEDQQIRLLQAARLLPKNKEIDEKILWKLRDGKGLIPSADLLIRTAGEKRTSDIGWLNGAPTELYFIDSYAPDITTSDIVNAIVDFSKRERRLGGCKSNGRSI